MAAIHPSLPRLLLLAASALVLGVLYSWWRIPDPSELSHELESIDLTRNVGGRVEIHEGKPLSASLEPLRMPLVSSSETTERRTIFRVRGEMGKLSGAFIAFSEAGNVESGRILMGDKPLGGITWTTDRGPPMLMIGASEHLPVFLENDDQRWQLPEVEIILQRQVEILISVLDLLTGESIPKAVIRNHGLRRMHHPTPQVPPSWMADAPTQCMTDELGRARLLLPQKAEYVQISVEAMGYWPLRRHKAHLSQREAALKLAPLLVAGLWIQSGREDLDVRLIGQVAISQEGESPLKITGAPRENKSELLRILDERTGRSQYNTLWNFGTLRPSIVESSIEPKVSVPLSAEFEYRPFANSDGIKGILKYYPVSSFRAEFIEKINIDRQVAQRLGSLEVVFEGIHAEDELPGAWVVQPEQESLFRVIPPADPVIEEGQCTYKLQLGSGRYVVGPEKGFLSVATFEPIKLEVLPGCVNHVTVPKTNVRTGELVVQILDEDGNVDVNPHDLSITKNDEAGVVVVPVQGETKFRLLEGTYEVRFFASDTVSEVMPIEIKAMSTTRTVFDRRDIDSR